MQQDKPVSDIMARNPLTVTEDQKLSEVRHLVTEKDLHHVPVVSGKKLIGLVSGSDLLRAATSRGDLPDASTLDTVLDTMSIRDVMVEDVLTIQADDTIKHAAELLSTGRFHALPVLDGEEVVGVLTSSDLIRFLLSLY